MKEVDFTLQVGNTSSLKLRNNKLSLKLRNLLSNVKNIVQFLLVVDFSLFKGGLLDLNLLIEKSELFISLYKLCSKNISLIDDHLVVLSLLLFFTLSLGNNILETSNIRLLSLDHFL